MLWWAALRGEGSMGAGPTSRLELMVLVDAVDGVCTHRRPSKR